MTQPTKEFAFNESIAQEAITRWQDAAGQRAKIQKSLKAGHYDKVESSERMAKRMNRALDTVKKRIGAGAVEFMSKDVREVMATGVKEDDVSNLLMERVIGETNELLQIDFLIRGKLVSARIGRTSTKLGAGRVGYGTGFLIAPGLMMTNWHVLEEADWAARTTFELDYQPGFEVQEFALEPDRLFINDKGLDFAVVAVADKSKRGSQLSTYGWCPLIGAEGKISIGEPVNIIQHPLGQMKQVVFRNNELTDLEQKEKEEDGEQDGTVV
jgi:endonuclease G